MGEEVDDADEAARIVREYADGECVGELGDVVDTRREDGVWVVEFRTHTLTDAYDHRVRINSVGNVFSHERTDRTD